MKKYELTKNKNERGLYQIRALIDIPSKGVKVGDLGGYIQSEDNLSHKGSCWVSDNARVYGDARVFGNARVSGNARVYGNAWVFNNARVYDKARVFGDAEVYGDAWVSDNARVYGDAWVFDNARVYGDARVFGNARVSGNSKIYGDVKIKTNKDYVCIGPVGDNDRYITFTKSNKMVKAGCFHGDLKAFKKAVDAKYDGEGDYYDVIKYLKILTK